MNHIINAIDVKKKEASLIISLLLHAPLCAIGHSTVIISCMILNGVEYIILSVIDSGSYCSFHAISWPVRREEVLFFLKKKTGCLFNSKYL